VARPEGFGFLCGEELRSAITAGGFAVNEEKFRVQVHGMRKSVTGLVVNRQVNVRRRFVRDVRAMINSWRTKGYAAAKSVFETRYWHGSTAFNATPPEFARVLRGRLEHIRSIKGDTEVVYSLFTQLAALDQEPSLQRTVEAMRRSRESLVRRLERAVCVIESDDSCEQGTGFLIKDMGLVTCAHAYRDDSVAFLPSLPTKRFRLSAVHVDPDRDIAILAMEAAELDERDFLAVEMEPNLDLGVNVTVAGYANYAPGASLSIKQAQISQHRKAFGFARCAINTGIIAGMSGGPMLNENGRVLGIAVEGASSNSRIDDPDFRHGVVPWTEVIASRSARQSVSGR